MDKFYTKKECCDFIAKNNLDAIPMPQYSECKDTWDQVLFWYAYYI